MSRNLVALVLTLTLCGFLAGQTQAAPGLLMPPRQGAIGEAYIVQANDSLSKIADKYYGNPRKYPDIIEATNSRATEDNSFATIDNPNFIRVGQKLWVPPQEGAGLFTVGETTFKRVAIQSLGIQAAVPAVWPPAEGDDPLFKYAWRAGPFSFVSFTTTPGNDAQLGVARLLGVNKEDLTGQVLGGQLAEQQAGDRIWTVYVREERGITGVAAATVQEKVIYQISLFAASSQQETILQTILDNFEIIDPAAAQQTITITAPAAGTVLTDPFELRGTTSQYPFRGRLIYRVLDAEGNQVGRSPFEVVGRLGNPSNFALAATYRVSTGGPGTIEVAEVSASDGTIIAIDSVAVELAAGPEGYLIIIDDPLPFASVSSPVQIRGKTQIKPAGGTLNYRIVDADGQQISSGFFQATGPIGEVNSFDGFAEFATLRDGPGRVEVFDVDEDGSIVSLSTVNVWLTATP
jgi:hypothetical protein